MTTTKDWVLLFTLAFTPAFGALAEEAATLTKVSHQITEENAFQTVLTFDRDITGENTTVDFINQTIQVDVENATMTKARDHQKFSDSNSLVKSLYTYRPNDGVIRHRLILNNDQSADAFKEQVDVSKAGNTMTVTVKQTQAVDKILKGALPPKSLEEPPMSSPTGDMEAQIQAAALNASTGRTPSGDSVAKAEVSTTASEAPVESETNLADKKTEATTPLFKSEVKAAGKPEALWMRLLISIVVLIVAAGGLVMFAKWWNKNHKRNPMAGKIEVVSQFHLGPKRSLAIIRVAGEFILIGLTDHNVSMIKTLSLIDDEFEDQLTKLAGANDGDSLAKLFGKRAGEMGNML